MTNNYLDTLDCLDAEDAKAKLWDAREWFQQAVDMLYGDEPINEKLLDNTLDNLGYYLGLSVPEKPLHLHKTLMRAKMSATLNKWVELNNEYLRRAQ